MQIGTTALGLRDTFEQIFRVLGAVLLRDMRTRFGRTHLGYLIAILWPFFHLAIIIGARTIFSKMAPPMGTEPAVFYATGVLPYVLCLYPARMMTMVILQNKPLLQFRIVTPVILMFGRAILETLNSMVVLALLLLALRLLDIEFAPYDWIAMAQGIIAAVYLGIGIGFFGIICYSIIGFPALMLVILLLLVQYLTSGALIPLTIFPSDIKELLPYNPLFHCVEWLRTAYYGIESYHLDKFYVFATGSVFLFIGLLGERLLRGRLLQ